MNAGSLIRQMARVTATTAIILLVAFPAWGASVVVKVSDATGSPVSDAVIFALPRPGTHVPVRARQPVAIEQRDREFAPYVTVVQAGTTVSFPNRDPLLHHVYSFSPARSFEIKLYSGDAPRRILFDKAGTVTLGCNIHDWMIGYILVVETPYFGKTGKDGRAQISDMVPGEFDIHAWHPTQRVTADSKPIELAARINAEFEFKMDIVPRKKPFKPPLDGIRYQ